MSPSMRTLINPPYQMMCAFVRKCIVVSNTSPSIQSEQWIASQNAIPRILATFSPQNKDPINHLTFTCFRPRTTPLCLIMESYAIKETRPFLSRFITESTIPERHARRQLARVKAQRSTGIMPRAVTIDETTLNSLDQFSDQYDTVMTFE